MIDETDRELETWVKGTARKADVHFTPPTRDRAEKGVHLYLVETLPSPPPRTPRHPVLQIELRYLVTVEDDKPERGHRTLAELLFAALAETTFEVERDRIPLELWSGLGVEPRPGFILKRTIRKEQDVPQAPLVRVPIVLEKSPMKSLLGEVLGPKDFPIMGARVEVPGLSVSARTDARGRFRFPSVPSEPPIETLRVQAKGKDLSVNVGRAVKRGDPVIIRIEPLED